MHSLRWQLLASLIFASTCNALAAQESLPPEMVQQFKDATVYIKTEIGPLKMTGTGFVIQVNSDSALIATNHHVISKPAELKQGGFIPGLRGRDRIALLRLQQALAAAQPKVSTVFNSGTPNEQTITAEILGGLAEPDLAILKVSGIRNAPKPIQVQNSAVAFETMPLFILGFPFGDALATNKGNPTITIGKGSISSIRNDATGKLAKLQIDGALNPGNSGGPVVDTKGNLVGIAVQTIQGSNIGLAIPPGELSALLDGRVGTPVIIAGKTEKGTAPKYEVTVPVVDPMNKLKSVSLHYIEGAVTSDPKKSGELQLTDASAKRLDIPLNGTTAKAELPLQSTADQTARDVTVQTQIVTLSGQTIIQDPITLKVAAPLIMTTTVDSNDGTTTFTQTTKNANGGTTRRQITISKGGAPSKFDKANDEEDKGDEKSVAVADADEEEMEDKPKKSSKSSTSSKSKAKPVDDADDETEPEEKPAKTSKSNGSSKTKSKTADANEESDRKSSKPTPAAVWVSKISKMKNIPDEDVEGKIDGLNFHLGRATLDNSGLRLEMGRGDSDEGVAHLQIVLFLRPNEDVSGRKVVVNGRVRAGDPHIHLSCQKVSDRSPRTQAHLDYLMILEFGDYDAEDRIQPGKIYICLPDRGKSFLAGSFEARAR